MRRRLSVRYAIPWRRKRTVGRSGIFISSAYADQATNSAVIPPERRRMALQGISDAQSHLQDQREP